MSMSIARVRPHTQDLSHLCTGTSPHDTAKRSSSSAASQPLPDPPMHPNTQNLLRAAKSRNCPRSACSQRRPCQGDVQGSPREDGAAEQASFSRKLAAERAAQRAQARAGLGRANEGRRELDCSLLQVQ